MEVFFGFDSLPSFRNPVVTIGSYDGVHSGHRALLNKMKERAEKDQGQSIVISFSPHPRAVLDTETERVKLLNTLEEKILLLSDLGIDVLIIAPFTLEFSRLSSEEFLTQYLIGKVGVKTLVVGFNHHFGHKKQGNYLSLELTQQKHNISLIEVEQQLNGEEKVSSTIIRNHISNGEITRANQCLSRPYFCITSCDKNGYLDIDKDKLMPPNGEYDVVVNKEKNTLTIENNAYKLKTFEKLLTEKDFIVEF